MVSYLPLILQLVLHAWLAQASGVTNATCTQSAFVWTFNGANLSPCLVAADLGAVCAPNDNYQIPALDPIVPSNYYLPTEAPSQCECTTVLYNLAAACSLCQGGGIAEWDLWKLNCTKPIIPGEFVSALPPQLGVPRWAYYDPTVEGIFNASKALSIGDAPESSLAAVATSSAGTTPSSSASTGSESSSSSGSSGSGSDAGTIAGAVVGSAVGLAIIGGLVFFLLRKRRSQRSTSGVPKNYPYSYPTSPPLADYDPRPYDPNDPSTYPPSLHEHPFKQRNGSAYSLPQSGHYSPPPMQAANSLHASLQRPHGYSGTAEV